MDTDSVEHGNQFTQFIPETGSLSMSPCHFLSLSTDALAGSESRAHARQLQPVKGEEMVATELVRQFDIRCFTSLLMQRNLAVRQQSNGLDGIDILPDAVPLGELIPVLALFSWESSGKGEACTGQNFTGTDSSSSSEMP